MSENHQEIEVKLYVPDLATVTTRLQVAGAYLKAERVFERNIRYDKADQSLSEAGIVLRLRMDTRARLTYKESGILLAGGARSRYERELEVSDFDGMDTILRKLGFRHTMAYEKYRTTYELDGVEVVLDEMPYGQFVEIEGALPSIRQVMTRLQLDDAPRFSESYTTLFQYVKQHLGLNITDLTFENFAGVDVPLSAFETV